MKTVKLETWYDLRKFINDELEGKHLGKPVQLLVNDKLYNINGVDKDKNELILTGSKYD